MDSTQLPPAVRPHPISAAIAIGTSPQFENAIILTIFDATGERYVFMDVPTAENAYKQLGEKLAEVKTGLVIATGPLPKHGSLLRPNGN